MNQKQTRYVASSKQISEDNQQTLIWQNEVTPIYLLGVSWNDIIGILSIMLAQALCLLETTTHLIRLERVFYSEWLSIEEYLFQEVWRDWFSFLS